MGKNINFNVRFSLILLPYHQLTSPLKNRSNSDWRTFHPFPALMAFILPSRQYFKNVGLDIFRYLIAPLVVKTVSFFKGIRSHPFRFYFSTTLIVIAKNMPGKVNRFQFRSYSIRSRKKHEKEERVWGMENYFKK